MKIYFAADHAGFLLKNKLMSYVEENMNCDVEDCGAYACEPLDDYPKFVSEAGRKLSRDVLSDMESRAIVVGGSGQAEAVLANKFKGVRCAVFYGGERVQTDSTGHLLGIISAARAHDNTNALALGSRTLSYEEAENAVKTWIETPLSQEERHIRRLAEIDERL